LIVDHAHTSANANATVQCPVKPGTYSVSQTVELPKEIPKGKLHRIPSVRLISADV
jgi:hypothetical protein